MVSPQKEHGFVGVANELWDAIIGRNLTKRQKDILQFILRLSYGCNRKSAFIPKLKDFSLCGVGPTHVKDELVRLEHRAVLKWNRTDNEFEINKNYEQWDIGIVKSWDSERFKKLVHINIKTSRNGKSEESFNPDHDVEKVTETGSFESQNLEILDGEIVTQGVLKVTEMGSFELPKHEFLDDKNLPKQEVSINEMEDGQGKKLAETVSENETDLPKREVALTETGSVTPDRTNQGAASEASKKGLKKEKIKDILKDNVVNDIVAYLNENANKKFSTKTLNTVKHINGRLSEGRTLDDFRYVIDVKVAEWLNNPKMNQYLRPETLFTPTNFESYINQPMPLVDLNESSGLMTPNQKHYDRNEIEAQKIMEAIERERERNPTAVLEDPKHLQ